MRRLVTALFLLLALCAVCGWLLTRGTEVPAPRSPPDLSTARDDSARVATVVRCIVVVRDSASRAAIPDVHCVMHVQDRGQEQERLTDHHGQVTFPVEPSAAFTIRCTLDGYEDGRYDGRVGDHDETIEILLLGSAALHGRVVSDSNLPIEDAVVTVVSGLHTTSTRTDGDGTFRLLALRRCASAEVWFRKAGYRDEMRSIALAGETELSIALVSHTPLEIALRLPTQEPITLRVLVTLDDRVVASGETTFTSGLAFVRLPYGGETEARGTVFFLGGGRASARSAISEWQGTYGATLEFKALAARLRVRHDDGLLTSESIRCCSIEEPPQVSEFFTDGQGEGTLLCGDTDDRTRRQLLFWARRAGVSRPIGLEDLLAAAATGTILELELGDYGGRIRLRAPSSSWLTKLAVEPAALGGTCLPARTEPDAAIATFLVPPGLYRALHGTVAVTAYDMRIEEGTEVFRDLSSVTAGSIRGTTSSGLLVRLWRLSVGSRQEVGSTTSWASGGFVFADVLPGRYAVVVVASPTLFVEQELEVTAGSDVDVGLLLPAPDSLRRIRFVTSDGGPYAHKLVKVGAPPFSQHYRIKVNTDADGEIDAPIGGLASFVVGTADGYGVHSGAAPAEGRVTVVVPDATGDLCVSLPRNVAFTGQLLWLTRSGDTVWFVSLPPSKDGFRMPFVPGSHYFYASTLDGMVWLKGQPSDGRLVIEEPTSRLLARSALPDGATQFRIEWTSVDDIDLRPLRSVSREMAVPPEGIRFHAPLEARCRIQIVPDKLAAQAGRYGTVTWESDGASVSWD